MQEYVRKVWIAVGIAAVVVLLAGLAGYLLYGVLVIFAGFVFAVFLGRLSAILCHWTGDSYGRAYAVVVALFLAITIGGMWFMGSRIAAEAEQFIEQFQQARTQLAQRLQQQPWWDSFQEWRKSTAEIFSNRQALARATSIAYVTFSALLSGVFVIVLAFYFAVQPEKYRNGLLSLVSPKNRKRVAEVLNKIVISVWYWTLGRIVGMLVIGVGTTAGLWILGVPLPIPLGVLAGLLNFVPNFGPLLALVPAVVFALQVGMDTALYVVLFFVAIQGVESYLLTPLIDQHQVAFPPGLTLSVQLLFGLLAGFLGLLLAMPISVVIAVLVREFYIKDILNARPLPME